tara:strand:+ start:539 stop:988 length:450 start_codon:yes stop_codon:yes gene_type:complete
MIRIYTKDRHIEKITKFLNSINLKHKIFTNETDKEITEFELGISYCYPKKISKLLLSIPKKGFINYHPGPLPEYKGPSEYENAIKNKETKWGVTVHHMNEEFDSGKIIQVNHFDLHEPANSIEELGAISHYFLFNLFKDTIKKFYENDQ